MTYKVYEYIFPDGKIYIGTTKNTIQERRDQGYQHNKALRAAYRLAGWKNVKTVILEEGLSQHDAFEKEIEYISALKANDPAIGYNISRGGKATFKGLKHTQEQKSYMSRLYNGRTFTQEHINNIRDAHAKYRLAVYEISDSGNKMLHESLHAAAHAVGGYPTNISRAIKNKKRYKGCYWEYAKGVI